MKLKYEALEMCVVLLRSEDIITFSPGSDEISNGKDLDWDWNE